MNGGIWFSALAMSGSFLTAHAQTCGLRDNGATMTDPVTGIEIQKCLVTSGTQCTGAPVMFTHDEAVKQYGQGSWRLMSKAEADVVVKQTRGCSLLTGWFWTSTPVANGSREGWGVDLNTLAVGTGSYPAYVRLVRASQSSGGAAALGPNAQRSSPSTASNLDTPERWQSAQANQQQADRAFAGKRRSNDANANTDQPAPGPSEGMATNRGRERVNVAYCIDSDKRPYGGSLKCSAQRFGIVSVEPGASVQVLLPNSGLQAFTFACTHPAKPYDVSYADNALMGRCAAF